MEYTQAEILQTVAMTEMEHLDVRTVTLGLSLLDCTSDSMAGVAQKAGDKIRAVAARLVPTVDEIGDEFGIRVANKRISITPVSLITEGAARRSRASRSRDRRCRGSGRRRFHRRLFSAGPKRRDALPRTGFSIRFPKRFRPRKRLCSSVNAATTRAGINMDVVGQVGRIIKDAAERTRDQGGLACAKFVCFANAVEDNPFMAGAFHGVSEAEAVINVGVSGPGVVHHAVRHADRRSAACRIWPKRSRNSHSSWRVQVNWLDVKQHDDWEFLSASSIFRWRRHRFRAIQWPTSSKRWDFERAGTHGTTAALALLTDAVKKGGAMASGSVGGMSGAFIPVSEDAGMIEAAQLGALSLAKLEAWTSVCSVGIDMVAVPGSTSAETIAAIIADEMAIGVMNNKTTAVRIIPVPGRDVGEMVEFGGLLGSAPIMAVSAFSSAAFIRRGGRIPAPIHSLRN